MELENRGAEPAPQHPTPSGKLSAALGGAVVPHNWALLILVAMIPLQNIYLGRLPMLGAGLNFINVMAIAAFIAWKGNRERSIPSFTGLHYPVYMFMGIYVVSAAVGIYRLSPAGLPEGYLGALKDVLLPMLIFFIVLNSVRDRRGILAVIVATLLPLAYMFRVFYAQFSSVYSWHYSDDMRFVSGTFMRLGSNELAAFYAAYTFLVILLALYVRQLRYRIPLGVLALLNLYSLMYSQSRGAWLAFLAALFVVLYKTGKFRVLLLAAVLSLSAPLVLGLFPVSVQERFQSIFAEEDERDDSARSRFIIWENAMEQYRSSPLLGVGYRVFNSLNEFKGKDTHNYYLKLLVEQGPVGLLLFVVILWRSYKSANQLWQRATEPVFKALGLGMVAAVVVMVVANMFGDRFSHYPLVTYFWVYLALVLRALAILDREQRGGAGASARPPSEEIWRMFRAR